jgi:hypothetical protein
MPDNPITTTNAAIPKARTRRKSKQTGIPYASATAGIRARDVITKTLRGAGCQEVGIMDDFERKEIFLAFTHGGRRVQQRFSAKDWAAMYLRKRPYSYRMRATRQEYEAKIVDQGFIAINSQLRDLIKAQIIAIESGMRTFDQTFLADMLTDTGRPVIERVTGMLPEPESEKVVALPKPKTA